MKILLTGANGYIGMRLLPSLLDQGHFVYCCVRDQTRFPIDTTKQDQIEIVEADFLKPETISNLPLDFDAAYYLIHSMSDKLGNFSEMERQSAQNFVDFLDSTECKRIVYLSGIVNDDELSEHLNSRLVVENVLKSSKASHTVLRAGIIVGSGSASFEIIRDLVEKLPVMIAPKWLNTKCQPIAIRNVIHYLSGVLDKEETENKVYDIGGPEVLTYKEMLLQYSEVRDLNRYIYTVPVLSPRLSSMWLYFVTATSYNLASNLVDSMKVDVIAKNDGLSNTISVKPITYKQAVELAFQKIEQNLVLSSWKDAVVTSGSEVSNIEEFVKVPEHGCFKDKKQRILTRPSIEVLDNIWRIGGEQGWYYGTFLWKIRGYLDKLFGGIGLRRGRRSPTEIYPGDALDFWRVIIASRENGRLLLYAEMKLPGEAWLEFRVLQKNGKNIVSQIATFRPKGLLGRLYWYAVWPFHIFVFNGMINKLVSYERSTAKYSEKH
ncbi:SDR family oxidoreductase [Cryomorphaceae bacterium 1068]|nr:SDR family oxidoreductase [Cryomorphaceae bacterium 1068]